MRCRDICEPVHISTVVNNYLAVLVTMLDQMSLLGVEHLNSNYTRISLKTMSGDKYLKQPSQTSCVQNNQNEGRKAPLSLILHYLRLMTRNSNHIPKCF